MPKPRRLDLDDRIAAVIALVRADLRREWTVAQMASVAGVSKGHLRRMFARKGELGSPIKLLTKLRLEAAAELLADPTIRLKEILDRVGASVPSHSYRTFRRRFGASPTEFRARRQSGATSETMN